MISYDDVRKWWHMMTSYDDYIKNDDFRVMLRSFYNNFGIQIFVTHFRSIFHYILSYFHHKNEKASWDMMVNIIKKCEYDLRVIPNGIQIDSKMALRWSLDGLDMILRLSYTFVKLAYMINARALNAKSSQCTSFAKQPWMRRLFITASFSEMLHDSAGFSALLMLHLNC